MQQKEKVSKCTTRNPAPPCSKGFYPKKNKDGIECCYKDPKKNKPTNHPVLSPDTPPVVVKTPSPTNNKDLVFSHTTPAHNTNPSEWTLTNDAKFQTWITSTFIDYKKRKEDENAVSCNVKIEQMALFPHQRFIRDYLQYKSPYRGLLVYHGLGVGKSCSSIATAEMLINYKQVVVMLPASLKSNYVSEIIKCGNKYYDAKQHYWVFQKGTSVDYVSKKTISDNNGVWFVDDSKKDSNFNDLTEEQRSSIQLQINDIIKNNYTFINYNGLSKEKIKEKYASTGFFNNKVIIIDEVHNFISGVSNESPITKALYHILMESTNIKLILLSGTPIINKPNEIAYTINLLKGHQYLYTLQSKETNETVLSNILDRVSQIDTYQIELKSNNALIHISLVPNSFKKLSNKTVSFNDLNVLSDTEVIDGIITKFKKQNIEVIKKSVEKHSILPTSEKEFNKYFVDESSISMINQNLFMRRILGSVSHFVNDDPRLYPSMKSVKVDIPMSSYQYEKYVSARKDEIKLEKRNKQKDNGLFSKQVSVYKTYSRNICNFVFPENINRPKPKDIKNIESKQKKELYLKKIKKALSSLSDSNLSSELEIYSPKFKQILENVSNSEGTVLIYSQFSSVEGIEILSRCLDLVGYGEFNIVYKNNVWDIEYDPTKMGYIKFKSDLTLDDRKKTQYNNILLSIFNNEFDNLPKNIRSKLGTSNLRGEIIKILFITQSGAEGISLKNVRQVHITEPYWNKNRIDQVIGRANRTCSHIALPKKDRNFTVYYYTMTMTKEQLENQQNKMVVSRYDKNLTTDQTIYRIAENKHKIISQFLKCMQKSAVDCSLNNPEVGCFSFPVDMIEKKKAFSINIKKDILDHFNKNASVEVSKKAVKVFVKKLNKTFIYIEDTNELFDYSLYMTTSVLSLVGHMKPLDNKKHIITLL